MLRFPARSMLCDRERREICISITVLTSFLEGLFDMLVDVVSMCYIFI